MRCVADRSLLNVSCQVARYSSKLRATGAQDQCRRRGRHSAVPGISSRSVVEVDDPFEVSVVDTDETVVISRDQLCAGQVSNRQGPVLGPS